MYIERFMCESTEQQYWKNALYKTPTLVKHFPVGCFPRMAISPLVKLQPANLSTYDISQ